MLFILRMNAAEYGCKLQGFPTALECAISPSNVVCLLTGMNWGVQQPQSHECQIQTGYYWRERMSSDVCLKLSPGYYMKQTLTIKSCCTVSQLFSIY